MSVDVMFLCNKELNFVMHTLMDTVEKEGLTVKKCDINLKELGEVTDLPEIFVVDADALNSNDESRVYLCDLCIEKYKKMIVIGNKEELTSTLENISKKIVSETFERPIDNAEVAKRILKISNDIKARNGQRKILVVDDSPVFLRTISEWLELAYNVSICPSATAAFHMIEVTKPDLILLDYEMPVCSGEQFLEMLHSEQQTKDIPVIFLTSRSDEETVKRVLELGPQGYLLKSQSKENILEAIAKYFANDLYNA
ncbi:MAG: response regulator [Clostridia bacterium]|nr:response regulator [Clostridia bacterium]